MSDLDIFHFEADRSNFESYGKANGFRYWMGSDLMQFLDYSDWAGFKKAINKAMSTCAQLGIPFEDNFKRLTVTVDGKSREDYQLSRFACYFTTMFCDNKKPQVQRAFAYFAALAEQFEKYIEHSENCERLAIREEITEHEKSLSGIAKAAGVDKYPLFQNAGYRGMYNMNLAKLKEFKGLENVKRSLLDYMGKEELAANLFRITQTEAKLKNEGIQGQHKSETAAEMVGREVREAMIRISGSRPEDLALTTDIKDTKTAIKGAAKTFKKLDEKVAE